MISEFGCLCLYLLANQYHSQTRPCISQHGHYITDRRRILLRIEYRQSVSPRIPSLRAVRFLNALGGSARGLSLSQTPRRGALIKPRMPIGCEEKLAWPHVPNQRLDRSDRKPRIPFPDTSIRAEKV